MAKMAVDPLFQWRGFGNQLIEYIIKYSKKSNFKKIILYSNTILKNSIHLYRKHGFKEVSLENEPPYKRGNIKMELYL